MSYTRDWNNNTPVDHTKFNQVPTTERNTKVDISDRLKNLLYGFTAGETQTDEGVKNLPFTVQSGDPGATANKIKLYAKDVSAKAQLHAQDEDENVIVLTASGKLNAAALGGVYPAANLAAIANIMNFVYPVGSVVTLGVSTNPATLFGVGTWTAIAGKVIVGLDSGQTEFDALNETGGAKTVNISHTHTINKAGWGRSGAATIGTIASAKTNEAGDINDNPTTDSQGSTALSVLQPYIVKYCWERTA